MMDQNKIWESFDLKTEKQSPRCLAVNTVLAGKYLVGPVLGEGGLGITYAGYDLNMETRIAIKEYFPVELVSRDTTRTTDGGSDRVISLSGEKSKTYQQGLKKYVDEARNVSQFSGTPGIVSVKDFFYENDTAYIVMEYIEGVSLKEYLKRKGGKLPEEEALAILRPVLEALEKVHEAGIVHRDISPDNIMLTFAGEDGVSDEIGASGKGGVSGAASGITSGAIYGSIAAVRLIDFGAARMTAKNDQKSLTIILKHGYAPEEQYRSHGEQGPWTDVYALCAVLYRMLTGTVPEPAMDRLFSDSLKRPEELGAAVSPAVSEAILRGLAVKKDDRIQSVRELSDALYSGKKLKKAEQEKQRRIFMIAALAAGLLILAAVLGIGTALTGKRTGADAFTAQSTGEQDGTEAQEQEQASRSQDSQGGGSASGTAAEAGDASGEMELFLQEEELGEQIAFRSPQTAVSSYNFFQTLFCLPDGSVRALGSNEYGQCLVGDWRNVVAVAVSYSHSLGLRSDGRVYAAGANSYGQCETGSWHDIVAVAATGGVSFGLKADGTLEACGYVEPYADAVSSWEKIRAIAAFGSGDGLIGLDEDGTVHYAGFSREMPEITGWEDVRFLCAGRPDGEYLAGICEDGTIRYKCLEDAAENPEFETAMKEWTDICQLNIDTPQMFGVKKDGTAAFFSDGMEPELRQELESWSGLEAIVPILSSYESALVYGLKQDGTILEYRTNSGNTELAGMTNLKWIQVMEDSRENLIAITQDGRLLTYGLSYVLFAMEDDMQSLGGSHGGLAWCNGSAFLYGDGTLQGLTDLEEESFEERIWSESSVRQAEELWMGSYFPDSSDSYVNTGAYALLTDEGRVRIRLFGEPLAGTGLPMEEYPSRLDQAESWTDVVQILGSGGDLFGVHADGTVSYTREDPDGKLKGISGVRRLAGYTSLSRMGFTDVLALMEDGTVRPLVSSDQAVEFGRTQVTGWTDVTDIAVGESHVAGLLSDGTVTAAGSNHAGQCDVEDWENIVFLTVGRNCTLGITADGELKMAGSLY